LLKPTAVQVVALEHETPVNRTYCAPTGSGVVIADHVEPVISSANALARPFSASVPTATSPTAMHSVELGHDAP
jgi:hypothetical protein